MGMQTSTLQSFGELLIGCFGSCSTDWAGVIGWLMSALPRRRQSWARPGASPQAERLRFERQDWELEPCAMNSPIANGRQKSPRPSGRGPAARCWAAAASGRP